MAREYKYLHYKHAILKLIKFDLQVKTLTIVKSFYTTKT